MDQELKEELVKIKIKLKKIPNGIPVHAGNLDEKLKELEESSKDKLS